MASNGDRVVDEIVNDGGKAIAIQANVAKKAEIERLFTEAQQAFGTLDILIAGETLHVTGGLR